MMKRFLFIFIVLAAPVAARAQTMRQDSLRAGDVVRLWIWREKDLSGDFPVPETGTIVFPKIGPVKVTGRNTIELKDTLLASYQKYLRNPSIEVTYLRRVNVLGAVKDPGVYPLDETMTIAMALALAGGTRPDGRPDEVQLIRDGKKLTGSISQQTKIADLPIRSGDQLFVPERSWAARNTGLISTLLSGLISVTVAL
ncbi:MAG TPA: polysaccharide biosynthesis/export family protein, partial [Longimicrobiales bacterium]|nr:polysaccharide biosynthesis/export family protein [Longimicrobiales bacterium]